MAPAISELFRFPGTDTDRQRAVNGGLWRQLCGKAGLVAEVIGEHWDCKPITSHALVTLFKKQHKALYDKIQ